MDTWKARVYNMYGDSTARNDDGAGHQSHGSAARRRILQRYRRFLPPDRMAPILDIGCGTGGVLEALDSVGHACLEGVDLSPSQVELARARGLTGVTLAPAVEYLRERRDRYALITA